MQEETRSLWEIYDSEVEPWRRGRTVLVVIGLCYFVLQSLGVAANFFLGSFEQVFAFLVGCIIFWLEFYFIWIGVHWIRWLAGAWAAVVGFCLSIWGFRDDNFVLASFGAANLLVAAYFCCSPSVFFFAKRQRERRNWFYALAVTGVIGLVLISFFIGAIGVSVYKQKLEAAARGFADEAFARVFVEHDGDFLLTHLSETTLTKNGGTEGVKQFVQRIHFNPDNIEQITPARDQLLMNYKFPANILSIADVTTNGNTIHGRLELHMRLVDLGSGWQIENLWWRY